MSPFRVRRPPRAAGLLAASCAAMTLASFGYSTARAQAAPPLRELLAGAQISAPRIAEAQAAVRQAESLADQAGVRPNPEASFSVENFAGERPYRGLDDAEITAEVGQVLELGGKRPARVSAAGAAVDAARARLAQARADLAFDLSIAYADAEAAARRVSLAEEALSLALDDQRAARALVEAGKEAEVRGLQAGAAVIAARGELDAARVEAAAFFSRLAALAGFSTPFTSVGQSLLDMTPARGTAALDASLAPGVVAAQAEREAAARRIRLEEARRTPDLMVTGGWRRFQGSGAAAMVAGFSVALPIFDRNRGNISAAQAEEAGAAARLNAARLEASADIRLSSGQIAAADARVAGAREAERAFDEAYRLTRLGYEGGKLPLSEVIAARRSLAEARIRILDAQLARVRAEAGLARLQGRALFGE